MVFSKSQQIALALAPKFTGLLSIAGSSWIFIEVVTDPLKFQNVYHRLMLGLSFVDLFSSMFMFASTWPVPRGTAGVIWATGNELTCQVQGFFIQFGIASPVYNVLLVLYYQLIIQFRYTESRLKTSVEPFMHLMAFAIAVLPAAAGASMGLYHNANLWCWIAPNLEENRHYGEYRWEFYYAILWVCLAVSFCCLMSMYTVVRKRELDSMPEGESYVVDSASERQSNFDRKNNFLGDSRHSESWRTSFIVSQRLSHSDRGSSIISRVGESWKTSSTRSQRLNLNDRRSSTRSMRSSSERQVAMDAEAVVNAISKIKSSKRLSSVANSFASRSVYEQAVWYTVAFFVTYTFATLNRVVQQSTGVTYFPLMLLHVLFLPLQGAFNFAVYRRNAYNRLKQQYPHMTAWQAFHRTIRWTFLGPPKTEAELEESKMPEQSVARLSGMKSPHWGALAVDTQSLQSDKNALDSPYNKYTDEEDLLQDIDDDMVCIMDDMVADYTDFPNLLTDESVSPTRFPTLHLEEDSPSFDRGSTQWNPRALFSALPAII